jgi:hypothetical protein
MGLGTAHSQFGQTRAVLSSIVSSTTEKSWSHLQYSLKQYFLRAISLPPPTNYQRHVFGRPLSDFKLLRLAGKSSFWKGVAAVRRKTQRIGAGALALVAAFAALIALLGLAWVLSKVKGWLW